MSRPQAEVKVFLLRCARVECRLRTHVLRGRKERGPRSEAVARRFLEASVSPGPARYDCVVAGGGPAGAFLAYLLASSGVRVLVLEKRRFPRSKTCGGGVTRRAMDLLPFRIDEVLEDEILSARVGLGPDHCLEEIVSESPMIGMVMRDRFDSFLVERAVEAGAVFLDGTPISSVSGRFGNLCVRTPGETFSTAVVAGADGVNSLVARNLGLASRGGRVPALEAEIGLRDGGALARFRHTVHFDFGVVPAGYGWVFPKRDHLSVGVLSLSLRGRGLKAALDRYLGHKGLAGDRIEVRSAKAHAIPMGPRRRRGFAVPQGLLVGDAAGLADPITGEGIYHALRQARIASGVIVRSIREGRSSLADFNCLLQREFQGESLYGRWLAFLLYRFPSLSHRLIRANGPAVTDRYLEVIRGGAGYRELFLDAVRPGNLLRRPGR